jgi:hypothetical protein
VRGRVGDSMGWWEQVIACMSMRMQVAMVYKSERAWLAVLAQVRGVVPRWMLPATLPHIHHAEAAQQRSAAARRSPTARACAPHQHCPPLEVDAVHLILGQRHGLVLPLVEAAQAVPWGWQAGRVVCVCVGGGGGGGVMRVYAAHDYMSGQLRGGCGCDCCCGGGERVLEPVPACRCRYRY